MDIQDKTKEELIKELQELQQAYNSLKATIETDLLTHKLTEDELRTSEERFQLLFNKAPLGYQSLDFNGNFIDVNQQWLDTLGYEREEVIGKWFGDFLTPAYQDGFRKRFPIFKERGKIHSEFEMVHKNGSVLFIAFDGRIGYDSDGAFKQTHCILKDITSQKQAEKELLKSQMLLHAMEKAAKIGGWEFDVETMVQTWTDEIFHILEIDTSHGAPDVPEGIGFIAPEYQPMAMLGIQRAIEFGEPYNQEWQVITAKGNKRWINAIATPHLENGKTKFVSGSFQDITERKLTEIALAESEENLSTTLHSIGDGVISTDKNGLIVQMNPVAETLCGWKLTEALGKTLAEVFKIINAETRQSVADPVKKVLEKGEIVGLANHTILVSRNGTEYQISDSAAQIKNKEDEITGVVLVFSDITEKYVAEKQLKESESYLKETQIIGQLGTYALDVNTGIWTSSEILDEIFGIEKNHDKSVQGWVSIIHPHWQKTMNDYFIQDVIGNKIKFDKEYQILRKSDHEVRWVHGLGKLKYDEHANPVKMLGTIRDITERKQSELLLQEKNEEIEVQNEEFLQINEELNQTNQELAASKEEAEESEKRLRNYFQIGLLGMAITSIEKDWIEVNETICDLLGYSKEVLTQKTWAELTHPEDIEIDFLHFNRVINNEIDGYKIDKRFIHKNGDTIYTELAVTCIRDNHGKVKYFLALINDISERKLTEKALKESEEDLKQLSARLSLAARAGGVGVWDYDIVHNTLLWDDQMFALYGINKNDFSGAYEAWKSGLHPDDVVRGDDEIQTAIGGEKEFNTEFRVVWPDGSIHTIRALGSVQHNADGLAVRMIGTNWDITEQKKAEMELSLAKLHAEESDRLKSAFLANMSHEIRTPMNGILGFAEILKQPDLTGEQQQKYIRIIEKAGDRMLNIINDIVSISKIESGTMEVNSKESNINEQIEYIYTFFKPEAEAKGLKISFRNSLPDKESIIRTDREKVFGILANLVKNAIKYSNEGEIEMGYTIVKKMNAASEVEYYVKDTGIGIPKDRQEAIFERFIQVDIEDKMARQGAGLGLAITKSYVEMLGGKIWVESEEGVGSTFYFTLPYNIAPIEKSKSENGLQAEKVDSYPKNLKILIVEDDETSELFLNLIVNVFGKEILTARTGIEAIEVCKNNPDIDLILMDIQLPELNGYKATEQIRQFNTDVIIIAQTAFGLSGDREKAIAAGCNDYLAKPIKKEELLLLIQRYFVKIKKSGKF